MSAEAAITAPPLRPAIEQVADRLSHLLSGHIRPGVGGEDAGVVALRIAGAALGRRVAVGHRAAPHETLRETLDRIAALSGLLVRPASLRQGSAFRSPYPIVARKRDDGAPVVLLPAWRGWTLVDTDGTRASFEPANAAQVLANEAFIVGPALPKGKLGNATLLTFGLRHCLSDIAAFAAMTTVAGAAAAAVPFVSQTIVETIVPGHEIALLYDVAISLVLICAAGFVAQLAASVAQLRIDGRIGSMLRFAVADRAVALLSHSHSRPPASVASLAARCMPVWHRSVWHTAFQLTAAVLMALPSLLVMVFALPLAAMTVMAVAAAMACACVFVAQRQAAAMTAGATPMMSWLVSAYETLREIETVRAHAAEARFFGRWADGFLSTRERMLHAQRIACYSHAIGAGASALLAAAALAAVLYFSQSTNLATATVFVLAAMTVAGSMSVMIGAIGQYGMLSMQRRIIAPMLEAPPAVAASGVPVPNLEGAIDVDNVSLRRSPDEPCALDSVSFRVEPGSYVGIAGPSGSGKSTLLRVLAKMDTPTSGHVTFDGIDIQNLDGSSLRRRIGIVAQSGRLFPGTILENIAAGVPITPEEAWEAARLACASDDIETMPLGMSTPVSDANPTLSGGQIQRILIARAVVKKPAVLLLDEATSALDPDCEAQVIANLRRRNVTIVAVAHRLETIMACDRIHVIDRGQIVESGTFEELADGDTLFAALIAAQAEEPDAESPASCPSTRPAASAHRFAAIAVQSCETSDRNTLEPQTTDARRI